MNATPLANKGFLACLVILVSGLIGCQAPKSPPHSGSSDTRNAEASDLDCGEFISRVLAGEDFADRELTISGVALNATEGGLVNVGTQDTYRSGWFENFVSVYDIPRHVRPGSLVRFSVRVESSRAVKLPNGSTLVIIETTFLK